jgi:membrane protein implicated in regulation of membrane protease activity
MSIGLIYIALLGLGLLYALLSGVFGFLSDVASGFEAHLPGDITLDVAGADAISSQPITGTLAATFITGFGGGGIVAHYLFHWSLVPGLLTASGSGVVLAGVAFLALDLLFKQTQGGSEYQSDELVGREAEIVTPIPAGGLGEVAYVVRGQRDSASARATDGSAVGRGEPIVIDRVVGGTVYVRRRDLS